MIKLSEAVIVEGKYDKIRLENIIDATIITTDGFSIFKDDEKTALIKTLAKKCGVVIITDSDNAGQMIRKHIEKIVSDGKITNVYLPQIKGKEKRKIKPSAEGTLGLEGIADDIISEALKKARIIGTKAEKNSKKVTKTDFYILGLSGKENSSFLRKSFLKHLNLPDFLTANSFLDVVNSLYGYEEFMQEAEKWKQDTAES